jgi:cytoskeletal protein CcmA (bactofilin family)
VYGSGKVGSIYVYGKAEVGYIYVYGSGKVGSIYVYGSVTGNIYVYGSVTGSIYVYGSVTGSIYVYGSVTGSIYVSGKAEVGYLDVSGKAEVGSIDVYGSVTGSIYVYGTQKKQPIRKYFKDKRTVEEIEEDHAKVLALATPDEVAALRSALVAGKIDGHIYEGECACLVGTIEKAGKRKDMPRDSARLAEKWYMAISKGNTPKTNCFSRLAVEWIDNFTKTET